MGLFCFLAKTQRGAGQWENIVQFQAKDVIGGCEVKLRGRGHSQVQLGNEKKSPAITPYFLCGFAA
jgi:hypothetical protein